MKYKVENVGMSTRVMRKISVYLCFALIASTTLSAASLSSVHKIFIQPMENGLDQYIRAEISKQSKGRLTVVLNQTDADAVLTGIDEEKKGVGHAITGRYLGLQDNTTAAISLLDKEGTSVLWASEAGDRTLFFSLAHRNGHRKVASRIVEQLLRALK